MIDLANKKCAHRGCTELASFGVAGTKKREYCSGHAKEGMINVISKRCAHRDEAGTRRGDFCAAHANVEQMRVSNEVKSSMVGPAGALATPPSHAPAPPQASGGTGSESKGKTVRPPSRGRHRKGHNSPFAQEPRTASPACAVVEPPGVQVTDKESPIATAETSSRSPPDPPAEGERGVAASLKTENVELSSRVLVCGGGARLGGRARPPHAASAANEANGRGGCRHHPPRRTLARRPRREGTSAAAGVLSEPARRTTTTWLFWAQTIQEHRHQGQQGRRHRWRQERMSRSSQSIAWARSHHLLLSLGDRPNVRFWSQPVDTFFGVGLALLKGEGARPVVFFFRP